MALVQALAVIGLGLGAAQAAETTASARVTVTIPDVVFEAAVRVSPRVLNRHASLGSASPITVQIRFADTRLFFYLCPDSLRLNFRPVPYSIVKFGDGELVVEFDRAKALATTRNGGRVRFVVSGTLGAGYEFVGDDVVRILP